MCDEYTVCNEAAESSSTYKPKHFSSTCPQLVGLYAIRTKYNLKCLLKEETSYAFDYLMEKYIPLKLM